jgi:hypothetical protein
MNTESIYAATATTLWENAKAVRNACTAALAGGTEQVELSRTVARIDHLIKTGNTEGVRLMFLNDADMWPSE